jgi:hypothetical protein
VTDRPLYILKTFIYVLSGQGGVESVTLWFTIGVYVLGCVLLYKDYKAKSHD